MERRSARAALVCVALLASPAGTNAQVRDDRDIASRFRDLPGRWSCEGRFIKTGAIIKSTISAQRDEPTSSLLVRHDDRLPGSYHALEVWSQNSDRSLSAAISDAGGMRWYSASGWEGNTLIWRRTVAGREVEQFTYVLLSASSMRVDWSVSRNGNPLTLGDTLNCLKVADD